MKGSINLSSRGALAPDGKTTIPEGGRTQLVSEDKFCGPVSPELGADIYSKTSFRIKTGSTGEISFTVPTSLPSDIRLRLNKNLEQVCELNTSGELELKNGGLSRLLETLVKTSLIKSTTISDMTIDSSSLSQVNGNLGMFRSLAGLTCNKVRFENLNWLACDVEGLSLNGCTLDQCYGVAINAHKIALKGINTIIPRSKTGYVSGASPSLSNNGEAAFNVGDMVKFNGGDYANKDFRGAKIPQSSDLYRLLSTGNAQEIKERCGGSTFDRDFKVLDAENSGIDYSLTKKIHAKIKASSSYRFMWDKREDIIHGGPLKRTWDSLLFRIGGTGTVARQLGCPDNYIKLDREDFTFESRRGWVLYGTPGSDSAFLIRKNFMGLSKDFPFVLKNKVEVHLLKATNDMTLKEAVDYGEGFQSIKVFHCGSLSELELTLGGQYKI